jgi:hypothetical protein
MCVRSVYEVAQFAFVDSQGVEGGFTSPPTETGFQVYKQVP